MTKCSHFSISSRLATFFSENCNCSSCVHSWGQGRSMLFISDNQTIFKLKGNSKTSELQSKVVSLSLRCNGISDCDDGSDEENCFECQTPFECPLSLDNSTSGLVCLNGAQLCDRIPHCPDKFDEVFYCSMSFPLSNDRQFIPCNNLMPYIIYWFTICKDYQISSYGELRIKEENEPIT